MLQVNTIRENKNGVLNKLIIKGFTDEQLLDKIIALDDERKTIQKNLDDMQARMNSVSREIGQHFKAGKTEEAEKAKTKTANLKEEIKKLHAALPEIQQQINDLLPNIPNIPHESVPAGKSEEDNVEIRNGGLIPELSKDALPHWELAGKYELIDFALGNKLTGAGFPVYKGKGAKLQRALINYFLDAALDAGYEEVIPPLVVNEDSGFATGQLPDKEGQMYCINTDNLYLIPTAEVPVTNIYRDEILKTSDFPIRNVAYTPCFRREAGSYGKDVRGLNRLHQFDKVEIVQIQHPDKSYKTLEEMVNHVEGLVQKLGLPYRIMKLCGADLGFTSALTYDVEVFSAGQQKWLEVSSISNFEAYQANRLKLRFKEEGGKRSMLAHTLNGSALALPRIVAALLENNQTGEGIKVPEVLAPYTGFDMIV